MLSLTNGKKILCLIIGISLLFTGSVFAQIFDGDEETKSWVVDLWSPTNSENTAAIPVEEEVLSWNVGAALGIEEPTPEPTVVASGGNSGSSGGGRLGTANYALQNRSTLVTMERQAMLAQEKENSTTASQYAARIFEGENDLKMSDHILIAEQQEDASEDNLINPIEIVDHVLIAAAGRDDLVTPYEEPLSQNKNSSTPAVQAVKSSAPRASKAQLFKGSTQSILIPSDPFPIQKTHLLSWEGMDEDIAEYKLNVIRKIILNTLIITGKILFFTGIIGIIIALLFREKLSIFRRNKVRQLTLFSLLK